MNLIDFILPIGSNNYLKNKKRNIIEDSLVIYQQLHAHIIGPALNVLK